MWILDTKSDFGKLSSIQVAILFDFLMKKDEPRKITDIMESLSKQFEGLWEPKKGTIYPAVHNLDIRGFINLHTSKPYGYMLTEKGMDTLMKMSINMETQLAVHIKYYEFVIDGILSLDRENAKIVLKNQIEMLKNFIKLIESK